MTYRDDLGALRVRRDNLRRDVDERTEELSKVAERIEQEEERRKLPVLENLRVASPCSEAWDGMVGDDQMRFCGKCMKNVYNVSAMSREDAQELIRANEDELCLRLSKRRDGTVITNDCPVGRRRRRVTRVAAAALAVGGFGAIAAAYLVDEATVMGDMVEYDIQHGQPDEPEALTGAFVEAPAIMGSVAPIDPPAPVTAPPPADKK